MIERSNPCIYAPLTGRIEELKMADDETFSGGTMGDGVLIVPETENILSPVSGELIAVHRAGHAYGIRDSISGFEILIHLGIDTVKLEKRFFYPLKKGGEYVDVGEKLAVFDLEAILKEGVNLQSPVIVLEKRVERDFYILARDRVTEGVTPLFQIKGGD